MWPVCQGPGQRGEAVHVPWRRREQMRGCEAGSEGSRVPGSEPGGLPRKGAQSGHVIPSLCTAGAMTAMGLRLSPSGGC